MDLWEAWVSHVCESPAEVRSALRRRGGGSRLISNWIDEKIEEMKA